MSDASPPLVAPSSLERGPEAVNAEAILADFRAWLEEARAAASPEPAPAFDVATVLEHFIALRHEINLQTKSNRTQAEQTGQALEMLKESLVALQEKSQDDGDEQLRPLLKTLIEIYDALALARREVQRLLDRSAPEAAAPTPVKIWVPYWARWFGLGELIERQIAPLRAAAGGLSEAEQTRDRRILDSLLTGYQMSLDRIDRALEQYGLEPIPCAGEPFDPETMEVAEVVREPARTATIVLDEFRRGYRWRGRLFRCAQVRVARP